MYAETFGVRAQDVLAAMTSRVGSVYADEAVLAAGVPAWNDSTGRDRDRSPWCTGAAGVLALLALRQ